MSMQRHPQLKRLHIYSNVIDVIATVINKNMKYGCRCSFNIVIYGVTCRFILEFISGYPIIISGLLLNWNESMRFRQPDVKNREVLKFVRIFDGPLNYIF